MTIRIPLRISLLCMTFAALAPAPAQAEPPRVTIRGQSYPLYPAEKLRARGITPRDVDPEQDASADYIAAYNARIECPEALAEAFKSAQEGTWPPGETGARLSAWLDENAPALEAATRASAMGDCRSVACGEENIPVVGILLPTLQEHRTMVGMLAARAARSNAQGDGTAAMADAMTMQRMSAHVADGFTLIEHLVGVKCADMSGAAFERAAAAGGMPDEELQSSIATWEDLTSRFPGIDRAMQGERALSISVMEDLRRDPKFISEYFTPADVQAAMGGKPFEGWDKVSMELQAVMPSEKLMREQIESYFDSGLSRLRTVDESGPGAMTVSDEELIENIPEWNLVGRMVLPALAKCMRTEVREQSNRMRTTLRAATAAFERAQGRPPESLEELTPDYLPAVPYDPMTGQPFAYEPYGNDEGFTGLEKTDREGVPVVVNEAESSQEAAQAADGDATDGETTEEQGGIETPPDPPLNKGGNPEGAPHDGAAEGEAAEPQEGMATSGPPLDKEGKADGAAKGGAAEEGRTAADGPVKKGRSAGGHAEGGAAQGGAGSDGALSAEKAKGDRWRRYVREFIAKNRLDAAQRQSAWRIHDQLARRRDASAAVRQRRQVELADRAKSVRRGADAARLQEEVARLGRMEERLFDQLKARLSRLIRASKRAA